MKIKQIIILGKRNKVQCSIVTNFLSPSSRSAGNNVESQRALKSMRDDELYREYGMLKTLQGMGVNLRFEDFKDLSYRFIPPANMSIVLAQPKKSVHKLLKVQDLVQHHGIGPATFVEFLDVNGAHEVDAKGVPIPYEAKTYKVVPKRSVKTKTVYRQEGPLGFWKKVEVEA